MGTRSTITFYSGQKQPLVTVFQMFDGYISVVGHELANFLKDKKIINGYNTETLEQGYANGMECLAAQFISRFKTAIGGFYITFLEETEPYGYNYKVYFDNGSIIIEVGDFRGTPEQLLAYQEGEN